MSKRGRKFGYKLSKSSKKKIGDAHRGKVLTEENKKRVSETLQRLFEDPTKNPRWKGGKYPYWRLQAKKRDKHTCQGCGIKDEEVLVVDHIIPVSVDSSKELELSNLITLCANCHIKKSRYEARTKVYGRWKIKI